MAYFGWPAAHDNDAERAARAGRAIIDAVSKLNERPAHAKLSARIGIDSGAVVVGKALQLWTTWRLMCVPTAGKERSRQKSAADHQN
jgi:hypothetical protein